jgi:hypothetical protein
MKRIFSLSLLLPLLAGCGEDGPKDYLAIAGGGLTFNYRYSQATMVIVGKQMNPMPDGATVEALFDVPGKKERERVSRPVQKGKLTYKLESSPLTGIEKGVPLKVTLRLVAADGRELDREETQFTSDVDQSTLPSKPLVQPNRPDYVPQLENL